MTADPLQKQQQSKYSADAILVAAGTLMMERPSLSLSKGEKNDDDDNKSNRMGKSSHPKSKAATRTTVMDDLALEKKKKEHGSKKLKEKPILRRARSELDVARSAPPGSSPPLVLKHTPRTTALDDLALEKNKTEHNKKKPKKKPLFRRARSELDVTSSTKQMSVQDDLAMEKNKTEHGNKQLKKKPLLRRANSALDVTSSPSHSHSTSPKRVSHNVHRQHQQKSQALSKSSHRKHHSHSDGATRRKEKSNGNHHHHHSDGTTSHWERTTNAEPKSRSSKSHGNHGDEKKEDAGKGTKKSTSHSSAVDESSMHQKKRISAGARGTKHKSRSPRRADGHHPPETDRKKSTTSKSPTRQHRKTDRHKKTRSLSPSRNHHRNSDEHHQSSESDGKKRTGSPCTTMGWSRHKDSSGRHRRPVGIRRSRSDEDHGGSPGRRVSPTGIEDSSHRRRDINRSLSGGSSSSKDRGRKGGRSPIKRSKSHEEQEGGSPAAGNRSSKHTHRLTRARDRMTRSLSRSRVVRDDTSNGHPSSRLEDDTGAKGGMEESPRSRRKKNVIGDSSSGSGLHHLRSDGGGGRNPRKQKPHGGTPSREIMSRSLSSSRVQGDNNTSSGHLSRVGKDATTTELATREVEPTDQSTTSADAGDPIDTAFNAAVDAWAVQGYSNKPGSDPAAVRTSTAGAGLLKSVVSTTGRLGRNVASTTAQVGFNVASTTAHVGLAGVDVGLNVASTTTKSGWKAFSIFSSAATTAATSAISQANTAIFHGDGANRMMEGLAPGQNLTTFLEEMQSGAIDNVNKSWNHLKKIKDFDLKTGILLFTHLFEHCPPAKGVFGFPSDVDPSSKEVQNNPLFKAKSSYLIVMLDKALALLSDMGPDTSELQKILYDLGKKHGRMGVEQKYFPFMGAALLNALRELLPKTDFTPETEKSWVLVYNVLAAEMCLGMNTDSIVIESWSKIKKIPYYKERIGSILFLHLFRECPDTVHLFGISPDYAKDAETLKSSTKFRMHSEYFILMFEKALHMFEEKKFDENMADLGEKHFRFGVQAEHFPVLGEGLLRAVEVMLKNDYNDEMRDAWLTAYGRMSSKVISVMRSFETKE